MLELWLWRHPRATGAAGRCIGQTDLPVDRRRAKRLAHRVRRTARLHGLPRVVWTSPLRRCADVGRWLARWGWQHRVDAQLLELYFGRWDGRTWASIAHAEVAAWEADFAHHAPGGGEALAALVARCQQFIQAQAGAGRLADADAPAPLLVVAHAGWIQASALVGAGGVGGLQASAWPAAPAHGSLTRRTGVR